MTRTQHASRWLRARGDAAGDWSPRWLPIFGFVLALLVVVLGDRISVPYVVLRPGPAINTLGDLDRGGPLIRITGARTYPTSGTLDFTTVTMTGTPGYPLSLWEYLAARLDRNAHVRPSVEIYPEGLTRDDVSQISRAQMSGSEEEAVAVALRATGHTVRESAVVAQVMPDGPASGLLREGDVIVAVAGREITRATQVAATLQGTAEGRPVRVTVRRSGRVATVDVPTVERGGRKFIGVALDSSFVFPVDVRIDAGEVGGPSAGMMFALGVYDKLTQGELTGGQRIAGTGTIDGDGRVGRIDSIDQKMVGASEAGAEWFLAPEANCPDVVGRVPERLTVVKVRDFTDAVTAVRGIATGRGADLARCG